MKPTGSVLYRDEYDTLYKIDWETVGNVIDFTTVIEMPYVWGKPRTGYKRDGYLFRYGIVTVKRQVIKPLVDGYEIVAEGSSQYEDYIRMNYKCERTPVDNFVYHLNNISQDDVEFRTTLGSHWADPDYEDDVDALWADVGAGGTSEDTPSTDGVDLLTWLDVWPSL